MYLAVSSCGARGFVHTSPAGRPAGPALTRHQRDPFVAPKLVDVLSRIVALPYPCSSVAAPHLKLLLHCHVLTQPTMRECFFPPPFCVSIASE